MFTNVCRCLVTVHSGVVDTGMHLEYGFGRSQLFRELL